jgi:hypothetical protein
VAGAASVVFELVESFMVGNVLTPPAGISGPGYAALWLQPVYIAVGVPMLLLGGAVPSRLGGFPARASAIVLVALTLGAGSLYGWAAAFSGTSSE